VSIDGKEVGKAPVAWQEVDGSAEVAVSDRCYARTSQRVAPKPGERRAVKLEAAPRMTGLVVQAYDLKGNVLAAADTVVAVDGVEIGPAWTSLSVPVCSRELRVALRDESFTSRLSLEEGRAALFRAQPTSMVVLAGGSFRSGERSGHSDLADRGAVGRTEYYGVSPFAMDTTEVTVEAYGKCVRAGKCEPAPIAVSWDGLKSSEREEWSPLCNGARADRAGHPVNCVDWGQAAEYCKWRGKRLPTNAEWEWAARGGKDGNRYPWGSDAPAAQLCWSGGGAAEKRRGTCPVGSYPQGDTPTGLKDLAGNVWEWTANNRSWAIGKLIHGGGWYDRAPANVQGAITQEPERSRRSVDLGFRCVKDL
jgi:formylglycine-generating enzyme required for sulfatase activity